MNREDTYSAMAHLGECDECGARWQELRKARAALNSSEAGIDMRFAQQLLDRNRMAEIAKGETRHRARAASGTRRSPLIVAVAVVAVMCLGVGAAYAAGAPENVSLEFADSSRVGSNQSVSFMGPQSMRTGDQLRSWVHPDWQESGLVPVEARIIQRSSGANVLVASLLAEMESIIVTEQHGRLSDSMLAGLPIADVDGIRAYVLDYDPAHVVWQTGEVVISVACDCGLDTVEAVAAAFPTDTEPGFVDRVTTGLHEFADVLTGQ